MEDVGVSKLWDGIRERLGAEGGAGKLRMRFKANSSARPPRAGRCTLQSPPPNIWLSKGVGLRLSHPCFVLAAFRVVKQLKLKIRRLQLV
jgi:hypothetical protein